MRTAEVVRPRVGHVRASLALEDLEGGVTLPPRPVRLDLERVYRLLLLWFWGDGKRGAILGAIKVSQGNRVL